MVLICIFLGINDFENFIIYLLDIHVSSYEKCWLRSFINFQLDHHFVDLCVFPILLISLYILDIYQPIIRHMTANTFHYSISCLFILLIFFFCSAQAFSVKHLHLCVFAFVACVVGVTQEKNIAQTNVNIFLLCFLLVVLGRMFKFLICFE